MFVTFGEIQGQRHSIRAGETKVYKKIEWWARVTACPELGKNPRREVRLWSEVGVGGVGKQ